MSPALAMRVPYVPPATVVAVRPARADDVPGLTALEQRCFTGDLMSARQYRRHVGSRQAWVGVGERDGQLIGSAVVFFRADSDRARLYSIAVDPEARGLGLGAALLSAAEAQARRRGCTHMRLEVRQDNATAIGLYERFGYRRFGAQREYYEDGTDAWRYEKALA